MGSYSLKLIQSVCQCFRIVVLLSIGPSRPLPYAKLSGTNPEIGTCRGNFSINRLLLEPLIARPLTPFTDSTSHESLCP